LPSEPTVTHGARVISCTSVSVIDVMMNPGATTWPRASITRRAGRVERDSTATMRL
jgi:hypothetical protein